MTAANEPRFGRMIPAMVTPFDENLELDLDQVRALARRLVDGGSDALIVNGTTGESPTVFYPQKMKLFEAVLSEVKGEVPVIANVEINCTADTVDFAVMFRNSALMRLCWWFLTITSPRKKASISTLRLLQMPSTFLLFCTTSPVVLVSI